MGFDIVRFEVNGVGAAALAEPHDQVERMGMRLVDALELLHQFFQPGHVKRCVRLVSGKRLKLINGDLC